MLLEKDFSGIIKEGKKKEIPNLTKNETVIDSNRLKEILKFKAHRKRLGKKNNHAPSTFDIMTSFPPTFLFFLFSFAFSICLVLYSFFCDGLFDSLIHSVVRESASSRP